MLGESAIHLFEGNKAYNSSQHVLGDLGLVPEGIQGHYFRENQLHHNSLMIEGAMDAAADIEILKNRGAQRGKDKAAKRRAAGAGTPAKSAHGVTKRASGGK